MPPTDMRCGRFGALTNCERKPLTLVMGRFSESRCM